MIDLRHELYNLCQCADGSLPAVDYLQMLDIHSTLPRENRVALIGELKAIIAAIKELCTDDEVAMFEFYFQRLDLAGQPSCLLRLAKLVYPKNTYVGVLIAKKWRGDKFRADYMISAKLGIHQGSARRLIIHERIILNSILRPMIDSDFILGDSIERVLATQGHCGHFTEDVSK